MKIYILKNLHIDKKVAGKIY